MNEISEVDEREVLEILNIAESRRDAAFREGVLTSLREINEKLDRLLESQ
jgi:hypothetical protein